MPWEIRGFPDLFLLPGKMIKSLPSQKTSTVRRNGPARKSTTTDRFVFPVRSFKVRQIASYWGRSLGLLRFSLLAVFFLLGFQKVECKKVAASARTIFEDWIVPILNAMHDEQDLLEKWRGWLDGSRCFFFGVKRRYCGRFSWWMANGKWPIHAACSAHVADPWQEKDGVALDTIEDDSSFWKGQLVMVFCWLGRIIDGCFQRIHVFLWESQFINSLSGALKMLFCVLLDLVKFHSWSFPCDFDCFMMRL